MGVHNYHILSGVGNCSSGVLLQGKRNKGSCLWLFQSVRERPIVGKTAKCDFQLRSCCREKTGHQVLLPVDRSVSTSGHECWEVNRSLGKCWGVVRRTSLAGQRLVHNAGNLLFCCCGQICGGSVIGGSLDGSLDLGENPLLGESQVVGGHQVNGGELMNGGGDQLLRTGHLHQTGQLLRCGQSPRVGQFHCTDQFPRAGQLLFSTVLLLR